MDLERKGQVWEVFAACLERQPAERKAFLEHACGGDEALHHEVEALLEADRKSGGFLETRPTPGISEDSVSGGRDGETLEGRHIGPYKILGLLDQGGMGAVYLAVREYEGFAKRVALKLLQPDMQERDEILWRFRTERRILAGLDHPNVARFLDGGTAEDGRPYFVMEYVEGQPIDEYCDVYKLSIAERLELFRTVCSAVQLAHQNTVVHRDLKPANILVTAAGVPKLLDFGIAKLLNPELVAPSIAHTVLRPLTPDYASPEQVKNEPINTASDVYSLGVLLYRLLAGHHPYHLDSGLQSELERTICELEPDLPSAAVLKQEEFPAAGGDTTVLSPESVSDARATDPARLRRRLTGDLDNIVLKAMRKEPRRRYASVEQLSEDIRRHLAGLPVLARPATFAYRAGKFVRRHRLAVAAVLAFSITTLAFGALMAVQRLEIARALDRAEQVTAFLTELFEVSDPFSSTRELLDAGAEKLTLELDDQPEVKAELERTVGVIYRRLGLLERASPLLESALEARRQLYGDEHPQVAQSLADLGLLQQQEGDYEAAEARQREALDMRRELHSGDHADVADSLNQLGVLMQQQGDYGAAAELLRAALDMRRRLGDPRALGESLSDLAGLLKDQGSPETAEKLLREALDIFRRGYGDDHPHTAAGLNNLAFFLRDRGDLDAAEGHFREALGIFRQRLGEEHAYVAHGMHNLAGVVLAQGEIAPAEELYRASLAMRRKLLGNEHIDVAQSLGKLAGLLRRRGELAAAEPLFHEALVILRRRFGDEHPLVARNLFYLAQLKLDAGDVAGAESSVREALRIYRGKLPAGHPWIAGAESLLETCLGQHVAD